METDDEIKDVKGTSYDFGARLYDPRVGRWLSRDAMESSYPHQSTYAFSNNNPLLYRDVDGKSGIVTITEGVDGNPGTVKISMNITLYGNGVDFDLAGTTETAINKLLSDNIETILVNGAEYNVEFDINIKTATYESAFWDARQQGGGIGNEDHLENYVRVEEVNTVQKDNPKYQESFGSRAGFVSLWSGAGSNAGFFITSALSDPSVFLHELFHGLLLKHEDMFTDGTAPSAITATNTEAKHFPNLNAKNQEWNDERGHMVIKPTTRIPATEELLKILEKAGYTLNSEGTGIKDVVFDGNGTNTVKVGTIENNIHNKEGKVDNELDVQDKDPAKEN